MSGCALTVLLSKTGKRRIIYLIEHSQKVIVMIQKMTESLGIPVTKGTYSVHNDISLYEPRKLLVYSIPNITQIFAHLHPDSLKQIVSKFPGVFENALPSDHHGETDHNALGERR